MNFPLEKNNVYFTIEIMIDILKYDIDDPEIAIRCRNRRTNEVIFLWSYEKFKQRLALMQEWYADLMDDGIINRDHLFDPWQEFSDNDIKERKND